MAFVARQNQSAARAEPEANDDVVAVAGVVQTRIAPWRYSLPKSAPECPTTIPQIHWTSKEALRKQVDGLRDLVRRARRLNDVATGEADRHRLERFAEELEESASRLER